MVDTNFFREILIFDNPENLEPIRNMLSAERFRVRYAGKCSEPVLPEISFDRVDLIIVRWEPGARQLCRQLKAIPAVQEIPLLVLVSADSKADTAIGMEAGADDYLFFPFSSDELLLRINIHLRLKMIKDTLIRSRENAEASAKAKTMFLHSISHEIRTPMNGIIGMTDILEQTGLTKVQLEYLEIIRLSGENLLMLINDVLDLSKIEAGQITFEKIRFNLPDVVNEVVKILHYKAEQKNLEFTVHFSGDVPEFVIGDPLRLKQILINLTTNAIKFTSRGFVKISVSLRKKKDSGVQLFFQVEDSGIGISESNQAKLFRDFAQAEASTTRKFGGTGLGLAICRNLVELMNGHIGVYSDAGKGSNFYFDLEFGTTNEKPISGPAKSGETLGKSRCMKVLLVEDNMINQKVATLNLEKSGHQVVRANDGREAIEKFHSESPDLILMDVQMPGLNGLEATREIREWEQANQIENRVPIVAMTAHTLQSDRKIFLDSGMNDVLNKPFSRDDLNKVLERIRTLIEDKNKNISIWNSVR
jgi:signal transduction histidine kinase/ActR/RegA family two-component response regulator